jgi:hypothetical protein
MIDPKTADMITVKRGDIIESEFGRGEIVAITENWIIHKAAERNGKTIEYALFRGNDMWWIPGKAPKEDVDVTVTVVAEVKYGD